MNYKDLIINELNIIQKKEYQEGNTFKGNAYTKVIKQLKDIDVINTIDDLSAIKGLGAGIRERIVEIIDTGASKEAQEIREDTNIEIIDTFMNIYGIGRVKATSLAKDKIKSIEELRKEVEKNPDILNTNQKIGLKYYEDLIERIPRNEMTKHNRNIKKLIKSIAPPGIQIEIVGSYRRGSLDSGDIDVLIKWDKGKDIEEGHELLNKIINKMTEKDYLLETLAKGKKKIMGICKLPGEKARRLDILLTPEEQYPFAVLYFTGSDEFNVIMRKIALEKGYSMNEYGLTPKEGYENPPELLTEEDIFNFFGYRYIQPKSRKGNVSFDRYLLKKSSNINLE